MRKYQTTKAEYEKYKAKYPERWYYGEPMPYGGYYWIDGAGDETWVPDARNERPYCTCCLNTYWYMTRPLVSAWFSLAVRTC